MNNLNILACENYCEEIKIIIKKNQIKDINVFCFPSFCGFKRVKDIEAKEMIPIFDKNEQVAVICGAVCEIKKYFDANQNNVNFYDNESCLTQIGGEGLIKNKIDERAYLITPSWLKNWKNKLDEGGFDRKTAIIFFNDFADKIVLLNTGIIEEIEEIESYLIDFSGYLELPYEIIDINLDFYELFIKNICCQLRMKNNIKKNEDKIRELNAQAADYAVFFNIAEKLYKKTNKEEVIHDFLELLKLIFSPGICKYYQFFNNSEISDKTMLKKLIEGRSKYLKIIEENLFYIKVEYGTDILGILEIGDFKFNEYYERYLNFAVNISNILGLALTNAIRFEELSNANEKLKYMNFHDSMTGLYNREFYADKLKEVENKTGIYPYSIFFCDIDNLKHVNDKYGHLTGDKLIKDAATVLKKITNHNIFAIRVGGDEFSIIAYNTNEFGAKKIKNKIEELIYENNLDKDIKLSLSMGYSICKNDKKSISEVCKEADKKMYIEKFTKKML